MKNNEGFRFSKLGLKIRTPRKDQPFSSMEKNMNTSQKKMILANKVVALVIFAGSFLFMLNMHKYVYGGVQSSVGPLFFPKFVMTLVVALSLLLVGMEFFKKKKEAVPPSALQPEGVKEAGGEEEEVNNWNIVIYLGILFGYMAMLHFIGFLISTPIVMMAVAIILKGRNYITMTLMSIFFSVTLYYVALKMMKIILPAGILFE